jgi:DNA ligase-1
MPSRPLPFQSAYVVLQRELDGNQVAKAHKQVRMPFGPRARMKLDTHMTAVLDAGGEGCILRDPDSVWEPARCHTLLKVKHYRDAEGTIVGYTSGRRTDKGSRLLGMMGAMILELKNGKRLELSGFTDEERRLEGEEDGLGARAWAELYPGEEVPDWIECKHFKRGDEVTYRYRELTNDGIPQEASYHRKRD